MWRCTCINWLLLMHVLLPRASNTRDNYQNFSPQFAVINYCVWMYELSNRLQECEILLDVGKGVNVMIRHVRPLVNSEVIACQFVYFIMFWVIEYLECVLVLSFTILSLLRRLPSASSPAKAAHVYDMLLNLRWHDVKHQSNNTNLAVSVFFSMASIHCMQSH